MKIRTIILSIFVFMTVFNVQANPEYNVKERSRFVSNFSVIEEVIHGDKSHCEGMQYNECLFYLGQRADGMGMSVSTFSLFANFQYPSEQRRYFFAYSPDEYMYYKFMCFDGKIIWADRIELEPRY